MTQLQGKVAFVTGASHRILETALRPMTEPSWG
jgi:hypothetical protein